MKLSEISLPRKKKTLELRITSRTVCKTIKVIPFCLSSCTWLYLLAKLSLLTDTLSKSVSYVIWGVKGYNTSDFTWCGTLAGLYCCYVMVNWDAHSSVIQAYSCRARHYCCYPVVKWGAQSSVFLDWQVQSWSQLLSLFCGIMRCSVKCHSRLSAPELVSLVIVRLWCPQHTWLDNSLMVCDVRNQSSRWE